MDIDIGVAGLQIHPEVCASHVAPRSLPKNCDFGKQILQVWLGGYAQQGTLQAWGIIPRH